MNGPESFVETEIDAPTSDDLSTGEVLLLFDVGGVCGSDMPEWRRGYPGTPGRPLHEIVATVVASRADLEPGSRVVGWAPDSNGLQEYLIGHADDVGLAPTTLSSQHAVILQPLACVLHALDRVGPVNDATAAIIGLGPIGLWFAHALRARGARTIVGVDPVDRHDLAPLFGLDEALCAHSQPWASATTDRFDLVIEAVGHQLGTFDDAVRVVADHGRIVAFGNPDDANYPLPIATLMDRHATIQFGRTARHHRRAALASAATYAQTAAPQIETLATHHFPVTQTHDAFRLAAQPASNRLKVTLGS